MDLTQNSEVGLPVTPAHYQGKGITPLEKKAMLRLCKQTPDMCLKGLFSFCTQSLSFRNLPHIHEPKSSDSIMLYYHNLGLCNHE